MTARVAPSASRNRDPILKVLRARLSAPGLLLEIASGSGEHALWFSTALPHLTWQPTDHDPEALASIAAWREAEGPPNLLRPLPLDATKPGTWPGLKPCAILAINMVHIAPWTATTGLLQGAASTLPPGAPLILYGPYRDGLAITEGNAQFDADLRARNTEWGVRDLTAITAEATRHGLDLAEQIQMPANNLILMLYRR